MLLRCGNAGPAAWLIRPSVQQGRVPGVCPAGGHWCHLTSDWARFSQSSLWFMGLYFAWMPALLRSPGPSAVVGAWLQRAQRCSQRVGGGTGITRSLGRAVGLSRSPAASVG